jgi:hypothetical protein
MIGVGRKEHGPSPLSQLDVVDASSRPIKRPLDVFVWVEIPPLLLSRLLTLLPPQLLAPDSDHSYPSRPPSIYLSTYESLADHLLSPAICLLQEKYSTDQWSRTNSGLDNLARTREHL